jgi:hypothetical protein
MPSYTLFVLVSCLCTFVADHDRLREHVASLQLSVHGHRSFWIIYKFSY